MLQPCIPPRAHPPRAHPPRPSPTQPSYHARHAIALLLLLLATFTHAESVATVEGVLCGFPATNFYDFGVGITDEENHRFVVAVYDPVAAGATITLVLADSGVNTCRRVSRMTGVTAKRGEDDLVVSLTDLVVDGGDTIVVTITGEPDTIAYFGLRAADTRTAMVTIRINPPELEAPTGVTAVGGAGEATISWTAVPFATGYTVTANPGGATCSTSDEDCTISNLARGTYTFTVVATGAGDPSPASEPSDDVTVYVEPDAPTAVAATPGDASATVSWSAPASDGGSPITGYTVTANPGSHTCTWSSGPLTCTVLGLSNGTATTFSVEAENAAGFGPPSDPSAPVTPVGEPGSVDVTLTSGAASLGVTWTAPSDTGGAATAGYRVRYGTTAPDTAPSSGDCSDAERNTDADTLTCLLGSLDADTTYRVEVVAINAGGNVSATDPDAIREGITAKGLVIDESPDDPAENDTPFGAFVISIVDAEGELAPAGSITVTVRLEPGTSFSGELSGTTSIDTASGVATFDDLVVTGTSDADFDLVFEATGLDEDSITLTVTPGAASALTFTLPEHARDAGLPFAQAITLTRVDLSGNPTPLGGALDVTLQAASTVVDATLHAVEGVTATADPVVTIALDAVSVDVPNLVIAAPVTGVVIQATAADLTGESDPFTVDPVTFTLTTPLPYVPNDGSTIDVTLDLRGLGDTPRSGAAIVTTLFGSLARCDDTPLTDDLIDIVDGTACVRLTSTAETLLNTVTAACIGTCQATLDVTFARAPDAPTDVIAVPSDQQASVTWLASAFDGGSPIGSYLVTASPSGRTCTWTAGEEPLGCIVTGLSNAVPVTFTVQAISPAGVSLPSAASAPVTPEGAMASFALALPSEVRYRNLPFEQPLTLTRLDATGQPTRAGGSVLVTLETEGGGVPGALRGTRPGPVTIPIPEGVATVSIPDLIHTGAGDGITIVATFEAIGSVSEPFSVLDAFEVASDQDAIRDEGGFATLTIRLTAVDVGGLANRPVALAIDGASLRTCTGDPVGDGLTTDAAGEICLHLLPDLTARRATFTAACSPACSETLVIPFAGAPETPDLTQANVTATDRGGRLTFAPVDDGGAAIDTYAIEIGAALRVDTCTQGVEGPITAPIAAVGIDAGAAVVVLTLSPSTFAVPLDNRVTYCLRVSAVNALGASIPSDWRLLTPAIALGAPQNLAGAPGDTVAWIAFAPVTDAVSYDVSIDGAPWSPRSDGHSTRSPLTLRNLTNGVPITVRLRAVDPARGAGPASAAITVTPAAGEIVTPAPILELVPPDSPPVVGLVDGVGTLSFISTITNSGDGPLPQAWLFPAIPDGAVLLDLTAVDRGVIFPDGNGRFFWSDLNLLPGETTSFIVRVQMMSRR
jgi:large repetitive protein